MFDTTSFINKILHACDAGHCHTVASRDEMLLRLNEIPPEALLLQGGDFNLLAAMFASDIEIIPVIHKCMCGKYTYPFVDDFLQERPDETLDVLRRNGFLENTALIDRIRECPICRGSYLNYIDVCTECKSLDFIKQELIHCFTCGRVSSANMFQRGIIMQCPFCDTRLRHIGSDYDFPLENYTCNACSQAFVEPDVQTLCYTCGARSNPSALFFKNINKLKLSPKGRLSVRLGRIDAEELFVESENYLSPDSFIRRGNWMLQMFARYSTEIFSLIGLSFENLTSIADTLGSRRAMLTVDAIAKRIQELLRDTDALTRTAQGFLWFLLPRTNAQGAIVVTQRLMEIRQLVELPPDISLGVKTAACTFEGDIEKDELDIEITMKKLAKQLE